MTTSIKIDNTDFNVTPFTFSATSHVQAGVGRIHTPAYTVYATDKKREFYNDLSVEVFYQGGDKNNMIKYVSEFAGYRCGSFPFSEIDAKIQEVKAKLESLLNDCSEPSAENKEVLRRIYKNNLDEGVYVSVFSVLSCRRINLLERRWIAREMLSKNTCTINDIINNFNYL